MSNRRTFLKNTLLTTAALSTSKLAATPTRLQTTACSKTTADYYGEGPFYKDNPPMITEQKLTPDNVPGSRIIITGRVLNIDCNQYIPHTIVDVWHASDAGQYDNQGYQFRGQMLSNAEGFYVFETILPGKYLNGSKYRPSHIHYKVTPPGFATVTTQLYFAGDTDIEGDAAASITEGRFDATDRIIELRPDSSGLLHGTFDIVIDGSGIAVDTMDLHIDKGIVYSVTPNPFRDTVEISYGVFRKAKVGLLVFDMQGSRIAVLEDRSLDPDKYTASWIPEEALPAGHYFVALKINDLQVHYQRIVRQ